ncbi:MAG: IS1182 family transposase [Actinobacteria bacterium]|nr:IS1182 family transposase [Actinomycetota bacterium]
MPPSLREWLPDDHLVWFVIEAVDQVDLSPFYDRHRDDGWGRAAFDPKMVVTLLLYAYGKGIRSAREIERRLLEDVAFRVIAANERPDHSTICRFRQRHRDALAQLFLQVLRLCVTAGAIDTSVIAIDGTKLEANASRARNLTDDELREHIRRLFEEADAIDAAEDELYGDRRGDELPQHLADRKSRIEWIRRQLADQLEEHGPTTRRGKPRRINTTDPDSAVLMGPKGFLQGYNAQLVVTEDQFIVTAELSNSGADRQHFVSLVERSTENLQQAGSETPIGAVVADAGYYSEEAASLEGAGDIVIPPARKERLEQGRLAARDEQLAQRRDKHVKRSHEWRRRADIIELAVAENLPLSELAKRLGVQVPRACTLRNEFRSGGREAIERRAGPPPPKSIKEIMLDRIASDAGKALYAVRGRSVEPIFGQLKEARGMRRFLHRGLPMCGTEWKLVASAYNLRKLCQRVTDLANLALSAPSHP